MKNKQKHIRFDWAVKKMLRSKANFGILEGFLCELLKEDVKILELIESEGNKETFDDKSNRVDILVKDSNERLIIVEIQNTRELDYFYKILYNTSKATSENIKEGREEGREEGGKKNAKETAGKMLKDNVPIESIIKYTGLTEVEIKELT